MKRTDLPSLSIFAAVATRQSFRAAARDLGLSVSAVSHAVAGLETSLGLRLLARTTRSVAPTREGRLLLDGLGPALAAIGEAVERAGAACDRLSGMLRLSVPRSAAEMVLMPLVAAFTHMHPEVEVELLVQDGFTDIVEAGFDAGIRLGESLERDMVATRIGSAQRSAIVGSPAYFAGRPRPLVPQDLHGHNCIRRRFAGGTTYKWEMEKDGKAIEFPVSGSLILNDDRLIVDAARAGAGLAHVFESQVAPDLAAGSLSRVLEDWCPVFPGFFLYHPSRRLMRPVLRAFIDHVGHSGR